ncbi:MAG: RIP metalloprotease RseP, partial [Candidatus Kapabacteria bacterium]|nr:RIP metalloprotease RseP [Candidatus Kapabacteria bacterium]
MDALFQLGYFILAIFPLVVIHEFGHFIAAILTGTRADVFAVGMGPRLFGWNKITGFTFGKLPETWDGDGHTDYRLCAFPIGGYVKILGMVDESFDTNYSNQPAQPWEFRAKNTWQKIFMISAGVIMNIILAVAILFVVNAINGKTVLDTRTIGYVEKNSVAEKAGFKTGDEVFKVAGKEVQNFDDVMQSMTLDQFGQDFVVAIKRNGNIETIDVQSETLSAALSSNKGLGLYPEGTRVLFNAVETLRPAGKAGLKAKDTVLSIDGASIVATEQMMTYLATKKNQEVTFAVQRDGSTVTIPVTTDENGKIGVQITNVITGKSHKVSYGFFESIAVGFEQMQTMTKMFIRSIAMMIRGEQSFKQSAGGPIMIAKMATQSAEMGWTAFFTFMATLSITLAVMNILPIP